MVERSACVPAYARERTRPFDRAVGDERGAGDELAAIVDTHLAELLPGAHRERVR